ncbi:UDP-glucose 4-epimerase GalE [Candidatus Bipolaricaulota bacterium]|nr:UDP-glucose 4-epimerase GalE [Candidatus Bipolaricaulota bacterium]
MILVTGGAGYIGSHTIKELLRDGREVVALDNLSAGHRELVLCREFVHGDLADGDLLRHTFRRYPIEAVIHFAAHTSVPESVADPGKYYRNNVGCTLTLVEAMVEAGVRTIVFSSSAAVYGDPVKIPIPEDHPTDPKNPYGRTKLVVEGILRDYAVAHGLRHVSLRYFNAAGSDPDGEIGECHDPETHLIPIVLEVALGVRREVQIFGTDYDTPDGTAIRDYIHVTDLARAHVLALRAVEEGRAEAAYNLGTGRGHTVREVVECCRRVTGREIPAVDAPRRPGDPAALVADPSRAERDLGWEPRFTALDPIVETAWKWMTRRSRPNPGSPR